MPLIVFSDKGFYCPAGDFYIDPWRPVKNAIITHAHADHCRSGHKNYLAHHLSIPVMHYRLGKKIKVRGLEFGEETTINGVKISLHPAAHILGSAQVRVEYKGEVWCVSGDYKTIDDGLSGAFEPVPCHNYVSECTFGLPVFNWKDQKFVEDDIRTWIQSNSEAGKLSVLVAYSLGKAQRLIKMFEDLEGSIYAHKAIHETSRAFSDVGVQLPRTKLASNKTEMDNAKLLLVPPAASDSNWMKRMGNVSVGVCSGWMAMRGMRRRRSVDRGFVLSDHADWNGLIDAIKASEAEKIYLTHGYTEIFSKYLIEEGFDCGIVKTNFNANDLEQTEEEKES